MDLEKKYFQYEVKDRYGITILSSFRYEDFNGYKGKTRANRVALNALNENGLSIETHSINLIEVH
jgi:hypothetical protein